MSLASRVSCRRWLRLILFGIAVAGILVCAAPSAVAAQPPVADTATLSAAPPLLFAGILDRVSSLMEALLSNQKRMLQFGLVMMLLGLFILWWRK
jgi:hypothetical protein